MTVAAALQTCVVPERFEKALKSIRGALNEVELDVVGEFEVPEDLRSRPEGGLTASRILLVSSPLLDFEAMALGRASAVFFPLHVLVSAENDQTRVSVVNPTCLFEARLPVGAGDPMDRLVARVGMALDCILQRSDAGFYGQRTREKEYEKN